VRTGSKLELEKRIEKLRSFLKATPTNFELQLYSRKAYFSYAKAANMLGYSPRYDMASGLKLSVKWLAHEGYLQRFGVNKPQLYEMSPGECNATESSGPNATVDDSRN